MARFDALGVMENIGIGLAGCRVLLVAKEFKENTSVGTFGYGCSHRFCPVATLSFIHSQHAGQFFILASSTQCTVSRIEKTTPPMAPGSQDALVIQPPTSFHSVSTWQAVADITHIVQEEAPHDRITSPTLLLPPSSLAKLSAEALPASSPADQLINYSQHVVLIGIVGPSPLPRTQIIDGVNEHLPKHWQFGMTGGNRAYTATANTGLIHGLIGVMILGIFGTIIAMRYLMKGWMAGILAASFDLTILLSGMRIAQHWALQSQYILLFPMIIVVVSLLMALSLDYEILLVHDIGKDITRESIGTALSETGGSITGAGVIIASTFLTLIATPVPFLQLTGLIIGVSLSVDTLIVRSLLIPTTLMLIYDPWPSLTSGLFTRVNRERIMEKGIVFATLTALSGLILVSAWHTVIVPQPIPSWTISHSSSLLGFGTVWQSFSTSLHTFFTSWHI